MKPCGKPRRGIHRLLFLIEATAAFSVQGVLTVKFGNLHASELIPPAPFSWEEKGGESKIRVVFSPLLFLREGAGGIRVKLSEFVLRIPPLGGQGGVGHLVMT